MEKMSRRELEYRIVFAIIVAGKNAKFAETATKKLFGHSYYSPFDQIRFWSKIDNGILYQLKMAKTGNYTKIEKALKCLVNLDIDLETCSPEDLEQVPGIGPKTSRFFVIWTRPDAQCAALDVHILRWLRGLGYDAPKSTPTGRKYKVLEEAFLKEAAARGKTPQELDAEIWQEGSGFGKYNPDDFTKEEKDAV